MVVFDVYEVEDGWCDVVEVGVFDDCVGVVDV